MSDEVDVAGNICWARPHHLLPPLLLVVLEVLLLLLLPPLRRLQALRRGHGVVGARRDGLPVVHGVRGVRQVRRVRRGAAAQVEFESRSRNQFITFQFILLSSRRFQHGLDGVSLHRLTGGAYMERCGWAAACDAARALTAADPAAFTRRDDEAASRNTSKYYPPCHPTHFEPFINESNGII